MEQSVRLLIYLHLIWQDKMSDDSHKRFSGRLREHDRLVIKSAGERERHGYKYDIGIAGWRYHADTWY